MAASPTPRLFGVLHLEDSARWTEGPTLWVNSLASPDDVWRVFETARTCELPDLAEGYTGFVLTGSRYNLSDPATPHVPFVAATMDFVRACLCVGEEDADLLTPSGTRVPKPRIVGGCFGAQLIAHALGGRITKNPTLRFVLKSEEVVPTAVFAAQSFARGLVHPDPDDATRAAVLDVTDDAVCAPPSLESGDCVRSEAFAAAARHAMSPSAGIPSKLSACFRLIESHGDCVCDLPPHGTLLATSATCGNEVFLVGRNVLAMQSHPEYDVDNVIRKNIWPAVVEDRKRLSEDEQRESQESFTKPRHSHVMLEVIRRFLNGA